jgi:hypothetical protein
MKRLVACGIAALVSACATPTLTYNQIASTSQGNLGGDTVISLPLARVAITPKPAVRGAASAEPPDFEVYYEDNPNATFTVEAENSAMALTEIAPAYRENTATPTSVGVETYDRAAQTAQALASIISLVGDPTFLTAADRTGGNPYINCRGLAPGWLGKVIEDQGAGRDDSFSLNALWDDQNCFVEASVGPAPRDAVAITAFADRWNGEPAHFMITPVCRRVTLDYFSGPTAAARGQALGEGQVVPSRGQLNLTRAHHTRWVGYLPDPNHIRLTAMPRQGTMKMEHLCSPPTIERGDDAPPSFADQLTTVLEPFRNPPSEH